MNAEAYLMLLMHGNQLKQTTRAGWAQRGVPNPENVAAHSYGVAFTALALADAVDSPIDQEAVLIMALVHDLPEGLTTDIPTPAWRFMSPGLKADVERRAMVEITGTHPAGASLLAWWQAYQNGDTPEARLVHDADKLDQYLQAYLYETQIGNRRLEEFWEVPHRFHFAAAQAIYEEIRRRRAASG